MELCVVVPTPHRCGEAQTAGYRSLASRDFVKYLVAHLGR